MSGEGTCFNRKRRLEGEWESGKVGVGETGEEEEVGPRAQ